MANRAHWFMAAGILLSGIATIADASDVKEEAIRKDRRGIEGKWHIVTLEVNGNKASDDDARKLTVVNGSDGNWSLWSEGNEVLKGTSVIDPTSSPKTIDVTPIEGSEKDKQFLGIYELGEKTRKLCIVPPGLPRPFEFSSRIGSEQILVTFERDLDEAIKIDRKRIEGTWRVTALEVDGNKASEEDAKKVIVVFGADGSWSVFHEDKQVFQGNSSINPTNLPKTIDFTPSAGNDQGKQSFGIYEISETELKFCVPNSDKERPTDFLSPPGSQHILISFELQKAK